MSSAPHIDRDAVSDVLIRYARGIDSRDWPLFRTCFTDDCVGDYGGGIGVFEGVDALTAFMREGHADIGPTLHRITNIAVKINGDQARADSYVHAILTDAPEKDRVMEAYGRYEDALIRTQDGWRISRRRFHAVRMIQS